MSSKYVRDTFAQYLEDNSAEANRVDFSLMYDTLDDLLTSLSIGKGTDWLGIDYIGNDEEPITIGSSNNRGKYRENGSIYLHVVEPASLQAISGILTRGKALRDLLRGRRIGNIVIESVSPINTAAGTTLQFEGGWFSGSFFANYYCDFDN